jgi:septal ring factor EnvC (AmiA/AmiB activator)
VSTRAFGAEKECATYKREMAALHVHITELQKEKAQLLKRLEQADSHIKKVDGSVSRLSTSHGKSEAELKAALSKLASEQARLKACVDAMIDSKR